MISALFLFSALLLPCGGEHLWKFDPYPGATVSQSWLCVPGNHRGRNRFPWSS
jgi:hypothetical protein